MVYPISQIFGPTYQGEGPLIGTRTFFVRFAGCDFDCSWCDTKYAVSPKYPGWIKTMMTINDVVRDLTKLGWREWDWVTLSGGNPALFVDEEFCSGIRSKLAMETQGSVALKKGVSPWIYSLVVSPKPPSSGMASRYDSDLVYDMMFFRETKLLTTLKYVVFDEADLEWTIEISKGFEVFRRFLSVGTTTPETILEKTKWLMERAATDVRLKDFTILPQLHTLIWGRRTDV